MSPPAMHAGRLRFAALSRMALIGLATATAVASVSGGCLLGEEYNKVEASLFCVEPGEAPSPKSCDGAEQACGPGRNVYCCEAPAIPCGDIARDVDGRDFPTAAGREATVSDFRLDAYEVTVARFRAFIAAGQGSREATNPSQGLGGHPRYLNSGWDPDTFFDALEETEADLRNALACASDDRNQWTDTAGDNENRPINCVTWYEALLFCAWDGGRLPTEVEWHYAAAGGDEQRPYPWEEPAGVLDPDLAVFGCPDTNAACPTGTGIAPVGSKENGVGRWGHFDMSGNVAEWVLDTILDADDYVTPCEDCMRIGDGNRGVRGGGFNVEHQDGVVDALLVSHRVSAPPATRSAAIGFRCVKPVL